MPLAPDLLLLSRRRKASCVNARHSSEGWNPVLALNFFEVQGFHSPCGRAGNLQLVIPAKAGIQFLALIGEVQSFHSPCGRAGNFLCLCKESNQRNTPPVARSPGILPSESARGLRGSLNARPCACSERARIVRATLRASSSTRSPRHRGPRLGGILPQKQQQRLALVALEVGLYGGERSH